jgi:gamma-glutamyl hercynylcysteine S-oxide hydrolase
MCRHIAYLGPAVPLRKVLTEPPHALYRQSWAPRAQRHGTVNADGFGVGWYAPADPVPARYRRARPIWADPAFTDLARVVRSGALLAAVRDTTDGGTPDESAAAPYADGAWLFSHNGAIDGWPGSVAGLAAQRLPPEALLGLEARCDAALAWALVAHRLREGAPPGDALADTVADIAALTPARLNFLLTDGATIAATTWGDSLWHRLEAGSHVVVASEPYDDEPGWTEVPDHTVLLATPDGIDVTPLKEPPA